MIENIKWNETNERIITNKETETTHSKFMNNLPLLRILAIMQVLSRDQSIA